MTEADKGTGESQPADDIRSALASAIASHDEAETPAEKPAKAEKTEEPEPEAAKEEPEVKEPEEKTEGDKKPEPEKATAEKTEADKAATKEPPANWPAADKVAFKALPEPAQQFLLKRHKDMEADYTKKTQAISDLKKEYEPVDQLFAPYKDTMRAKGFSPRTLIEAWANVEKELASGPERAVKIVQGLVTGYKIPVEKIAAALGIKAAPAQQVEPGADGKLPAVDPAAAKIELPPEIVAELSEIKREIAATKGERVAVAQRQEFERGAKIEQEIEDFKGAKDEKGNLLHPHFDEVYDHMVALAQAKVALKQPMPPYKELYETAVWANPSTREQVRTAEQQAADKKRADEARAKTAAAKRASASVTGAPGAGQAPSGRRGGELSLREQLLEAAEEADA
jgi:hypothetical protein